MRVFSPLQEHKAKEHFSTGDKLSSKGILNLLLAAGFHEASLPDKTQRQNWLRNHRPRTPTTCDELPRQVVVERSLADWPVDTPEACSDLFLPRLSPYRLSGNRVCIPFSCRGMLKTMPRYNDQKIVLFIDANMGCMQHGWSVAL